MADEDIPDSARKPPAEEGEDDEEGGTPKKKKAAKKPKKDEDGEDGEGADVKPKKVCSCSFGTSKQLKATGPQAEERRGQGGR